MAKKLLTKKSKKNLLRLGGVILLVIGVGALIRGCNPSEDDNGLVEIHPSYSIGGIQETTGKYEESDYTLYTKTSFRCDGLEITSDFDSEVTYQIFFYDESGAFLNATEVLDGNYREEVPDFATHARLELTPIFPADVKQEDRKLNWFNYRQYTNDLTIRVEKEKDSEVYNIISENLFGYSGLGTFGSGTFTADESSTTMVSTIMDVTAYDRVLITIPYSMYQSSECYIYGREGTNGNIVIKNTTWSEMDVELANSKVTFVFEIGDSKSLVMTESTNSTSVNDFKAIEVYGIE